jgi:leucyl aminopeptidase
MDFKHQIGSALQLATLRADALLLVVTPDLLESTSARQDKLALDPVLKRLIADAVKAGDFALKSGRTLYLHHPGGVVAARVVVSVAANDSAKAYKAALAQGLTLLKAGGASQLLVGTTFIDTASPAPRCHPNGPV